MENPMQNTRIAGKFLKLSLEYTTTLFVFDGDVIKEPKNESHARTLYTLFEILSTDRATIPSKEKRLTKQSPQILTPKLKKCNRS